MKFFRRKKKEDKSAEAPKEKSKISSIRFFVTRLLVGVVMVAFVLWLSMKVIHILGGGEEQITPGAHQEKDVPTEYYTTGTKKPDGDTEIGKTPSTHGMAEERKKRTTAENEKKVYQTHSEKPRGVAFVDALIKPIDYEVNERFWGWRVNDILKVTDNVNNYQRGVLEVTRRTTIILTERISRTGKTASFDENLERAMNWFMVKAEAFWFPSAESKYNEGLEELRKYRKKLERGGGIFYNRADNLIPLLSAYEDLLGSCDENLVKEKMEDTTEVGWAEADDYFYYAKGVAYAMEVILEAVSEDFYEAIVSAQGMPIINNAIYSLQHAHHIKPWIILESDLSSIFANHRANMAAPISHARFYLGVLITALTT